MALGPLDGGGSGGGGSGGFSSVVSGSVTLSGGTATVSTGVTEPITVLLDPSNGGQANEDVDVIASARYDSSAGEVVVEFEEDSTAVGNPTVGYEALSVGGSVSVSVVASGVVQLQNGIATVETSVSAPLGVSIDPSNGGQASEDVDVAASARHDSSKGANVVEIGEDSTAVGNPTVGYEITEVV